jgi:hypothetical protein
MRTPDAWIIERIRDRQREEDERSWQRQPRLELPLMPPEHPAKRQQPEETDERGSVRIDYSV